MVSFPHTTTAFATADLLSKAGYIYDWRGRRAAGTLGRMIGDSCEALIYADRVLVRGRNTQPLIALLAEHSTPPAPPLRVIRPRNKVKLNPDPAPRPFTAQAIGVLAHVDDLGELICALIKAGYRIDREHLRSVGDASPVRQWHNAEGQRIEVQGNPEGGPDGLAMCSTAVAASLLGVEVQP